MTSLSNTSNNTTELQKRLHEIEDQIKNLSDEKEAILLKIKENNSVSNLNTQNSTNSANINSFIEEEEDDDDDDEELEEERLNESKSSANNQDSIQKEKQTFNDEILKNFDTLKFFFEETWDVDFLGYQIDYPGDDVTEREKAAYIKIAVFRYGHYIDVYDEKIKKASFQQDTLSKSNDQYKAAIENVFDALITRSTILELFESCGNEAGKLYGPAKEVSTLQHDSLISKFFERVIIRLIVRSADFTWSYQKMRAIFEFWQAGVFGRKNYGEIENIWLIDFNQFYDRLLDLLNEKNLQITEVERTSLLSILKKGKDYHDK